MLISLGLDYGFAPIDVRETFHRSDSEVRALYHRPARRVPEVLFVTTCNRLELYGWTDGADATDAAFDELAGRWAGADRSGDELLTLARRRVDAEAARHLLLVAGGLESQILGDIHILGQLRKSFRVASEEGALGPHLQRLFETAFRTGRSVRRETRLMSGRRSVGSEAAGRAVRSVENPAEACVVVAGCGKVGSHAARSLAHKGVGKLVLMNRSERRARELAEELGATVAPWERRHEVIASADAAIVATGAPEPVLGVDELASLRTSAAGHAPLLVIDVAMPRNVSAGGADTQEYVKLIDLDELEPETASTERARQAAVPVAEALAERELTDFFEWIAGEPAREALRPLREALSDICLREIGHTADDRKTAERTASRIVAKLLADPMSRLQEACVSGRSVDEVARAVSDLFPGRPPNEELEHHAAR